MNRRPYPFVSELLFRAKNQNIDALSLSPVFRLWRIEALDPDTVMAQLKAALEDDSLSAKEKLKLGFLIGYSWPLHYHLQTEALLLLAKTQISNQHVEESLLLWGKLASFYLRSNQLTRALEELTLALQWAKCHAKKEDIVPLLHWASLIFIRLNRPQDIAKFSTAILALTIEEEDSHFRQSSEYSTSIALMGMRRFDQSKYFLDNICQKIQSGESRLDIWNQAGALVWGAKLAFENGDIKAAGDLNSLSIELNQSDKHEILIARSQLLLYKLYKAKNSLGSAREIAEELSHYQDNTKGDLDLKLNEEIAQIRIAENTGKIMPVKSPTLKNAVEPAIVELQQSFRDCMQSYTLAPYAHRTLQKHLE